MNSNSNVLLEKSNINYDSNPKIRFSNFNNELKSFKLEEICTFSKGKGISKSEISEEGIPCIRYGELYTKYGELIKNILSKTNINKNNLIFSESNDILIPCSGETAIDLATASCVLKEDVAIGGDITIIKTNQYAPFITYHINNKRNEIAKYAQGVSIVHLYPKDFKKLSLIIPSIKEQKKIIDFISVLDEKIILMQKKHKNVEKIKEHFIQTKINEINSNSEFIKVKDAFSITRGEVIAKTKVKETPNEVYKYPVYSSQTLNDGIMGYYSDYDFSGDFITWTTDGANAGKTKFRSGEFKCSNVCGVLKAKKEYEYYSNEFIATYLDKNTYKYVSYVGNPKLMNNVMSTIKIPIIDKETADYYSEVISQFDLKYKIEEIKLNKLKEFKKGLLQKMFV